MTLNSPVLTKPINKPGGLLRLVAFFFLAIVCLPTQAQTSPQADNLSPSTDTTLPSDSAQAWLNKMADATHSLNFQMSFVVHKPGSDTMPYRWRHAVDEKGMELEQLSMLNGPGREALRIGSQVSYFEPNVPPYTLRSNFINGPLPMVLLHNPQRLLEGYDFILVGRSRISGRAAQQVRIVSKDKNRFGLNLWLDQQSGLLLKLNTRDMQGQLIEQIQVTELSVTETPHVFFSRIESAQLPGILAVPQIEEVPLRWELDFLPLGMRRVKHDMHRLPLSGRVVEYMMFSDGLVDVSLYFQQASDQVSENEVVLRHESNTFLTRQQGQLVVTIVGKLPAQTANAMVNSIVLLGQP